MKLNDIRDNEGARKKLMRVGRGIGSGKGKTCGRGVKGQKARTGVSIGAYEGGQMPLARRMPKRGFKSMFPKDYAELTLVRLQEAIDDGRIDAKQPVTEQLLRENNIVSRSKDGVRVLGTGEIKAKVDITISGITAGAKAAIEKVGGKVTVIEKKIPANQIKDAEKKAKKAK
jgi:large subunit ribosomal protein L15